MSNPLGEGKAWKEIIEILKKEKKEIWFIYSKDPP
jgi:hypothetical protein